MQICRRGSLRDEYEGVNSGIKWCKMSAYKQYYSLRGWICLKHDHLGDKNKAWRWMTGNCKDRGKLCIGECLWGRDECSRGMWYKKTHCSGLCLTLARFLSLTANHNRIAAAWNPMLCSLVVRCWWCKETCQLHHQDWRGNCISQASPLPWRWRQQTIQNIGT